VSVGGFGFEGLGLGFGFSGLGSKFLSFKLF
jgi:hypothetical protein